MARGKKTGGRSRGTPNKATQDVRAAIALIAERNVQSFETWLTQIEDPAKRCDVFLRAIEYHIPKLSRAETKIEVTQTLADLVGASRDPV